MMMVLRRIVLLCLVTPIVVVVKAFSGSGGGTPTLVVTIGQPRPLFKKKNSSSSALALAFASAAAEVVVQKKEKIVFLRPRQETPNRRFPTALKYGERSGVDAQLLFDSWEWSANLGAPAALVAGAVLATMIEGRETMSTRASDTVNVRILKKLCRVLLLSSFALEIISIFVTTVTGTVLLSHGDTAALLAAQKGGSALVKKSFDYSSPIGFLMHNFEFEYLTSHFAFLQGLFHWLASVAIEIIIPRPDDTKSTKLMNRFTASSLCTILVAMLSFLNRHLTFYGNYPQMLRRYFTVCFYHFFWPLRPLTTLLIPMSVWTLVLGIRAVVTTARLDETDEKNGAANGKANGPVVPESF